MPEIVESELDADAFLGVFTALLPCADWLIYVNCVDHCWLALLRLAVLLRWKYEIGQLATTELCSPCGERLLYERIHRNRSALASISFALADSDCLAS